MKYKTHKRLLSMALALALVFSEPLSAAAATGQKVSAASGTVQAQDGVAKEGEGETQPAPQVPAKVTNLHYRNKEGKLDKSTLYWDKVQPADYYEFRVTGQDGTEYVSALSDREGDDEKANYKKVVYDTTQAASYTLASLVNSYLAVKYDAEKQMWDYLTDDKGREIYMSFGQTYHVYVRAVNSKVNETTFAEPAYGEWSDAFVYEAPALSTAEKLTGIKYDAVRNRVVFTTGNHETDVEMEVKDSLGREYYANAYYVNEGEEKGPKYEYYTLSYGYLDLTESFSLYTYEVKESGNTFYMNRVEEKDEYGKDVAVRAFKRGETYTIRLRSKNTNAADETLYQRSEWSDPIQVKQEPKPAPEAPGNLQYNWDDSELSWNMVRRSDGYEMELSDGTNSFNQLYSIWDAEAKKEVTVAGAISASRNSIKVYEKRYNCYEKDAEGAYVLKTDPATGETISAFKRGKTYTVRVRAYNYQPHEWSYGERQYSDWSQAYTFTVPEGTPELKKVTGLMVNANGVAWNEEANASKAAYYTSYQIEIKDAEGRFYGWSPQKNSEGKYESDRNDFQTLNTHETLEPLQNLNTYILEDGEYVALKHTERGANNVKAFEPGKLYTVRVRAFRNYPNAEGKSEPVYGEWSDPFVYEVESPYVDGLQETPAKVTGLYVQTEFENYYNIKSPELKWNSIDGVDWYEIQIKDSQGNLYIKEPKIVNDEYQFDNYYFVSSMNVKLQKMAGLKSYVKQPGYALDVLRDAAGSPIMTFQPGETYSICVRAVNVHKVYNEKESMWEPEEYYYGAWSDAVTYKEPERDTTIRNLRFVREQKDTYYFAYETDTFATDIYYQVATDANFNAASLVTVTGWKQYTQGYTWLSLDAGTLGLKPGTTYYVRVIGYPTNAEYTLDNLTEEEIAAFHPAVTSFTTKGQKPPKNITGLQLYRETAEAFEFRFDAVLQSADGDYYELQTSENLNATNWASRNNGCVLLKSTLNPGTTYVRAVAYVYRETALGTTEKVYGEPSNVVQVTLHTETSKIGKLKLDKVDGDYYTFSFDGTVDIAQQVEYDYSDDKQFRDNGDYHTYLDCSISSNQQANRQFTIGNSSFHPGGTYYVRARVYNKNAKTEAERYSAYSNVVKVKPQMPDIWVSYTAMTGTSVQITMGRKNNTSTLTGYEIERQNGKDWITLIRTTDATYTDKKLKSNSVYTYRIRAYYFNEDTRKTVTGDWFIFDATTWGASLDLTAKAASATSVKLSWKKVSGAEGYEVYRSIGYSTATETVNGVNNDFSQLQLLKTLGASANSYIDSGLHKTGAYSYTVRAYKTIDGKKVYVTESASATLKFEMRQISLVRKANGKVTWAWSPVYSAKGYLVEKKDAVTGVWKTYKNIKKIKNTSITLPATNDHKGVEYRVRAYNGNRYTSALSVTVKPVIAAPTAVKATATANGVTISWKPVKGADYYRVYRTTDSKCRYDRDSGTYAPNTTSLSELTWYVKDDSQRSGYRKLDRNNSDDQKLMNTTKMTDSTITYMDNGILNTLCIGPRKGVTYYYYVVACKNGQSYNYDTSYDGDPIQSGYSAPAKAKIREKAPGKAVLKNLKAAPGKITVNYKKVEGADGYEIFRSEKKAGKFESVGSVNSPDKLSYVDKNSKRNKLTKKKTYFYKVKAFVYDAAGNKVYGKESNVKSIKAK